jgi:hypothetical protein
MAVELRNIVRTGLGLRSSLPSTLVFDYPTITALADHLGREVLGWRDGPSEERVTEATADAAPEPEEPDVDSMMSALEALSDDEVSRALRNRLAGRSIAGAS